MRLDDNKGFYKALNGDLPVLPLFIFDKEILDKLPEDDHRVTFIFDQLQSMRDALQEQVGSSIEMRYGKPIDIWRELLEDFDINTVYTNRDYEPYAKERDEKIKKLLEENKVEFCTYKDQVIYEMDEVMKNDGDPYVVYTPYKNKWIERFREEVGEGADLKFYYTSSILENCYKNSRLANLSLSDMGFSRSSIEAPEYKVTSSIIDRYEETRNIPSTEWGTTRLGVFLRFGVVSVRKMVRKADHAANKTFLSELIWREFFMQILYHFPRTVDEAYKKKYNRIEWRNNEEEFEKWKTGQTGYKLVDAGMRELNQTGFMHNRVRMLCGSFLCKHLLIDWRWGENYFATKLYDYEMSSNVGNWQWIAGTGVDAAPYFRIFNPITQKDKFDKHREYINKFVPEHDSDSYPDKMVDHKEARERALLTYKEAVQN